MSRTRQIALGMAAACLAPSLVLTSRAHAQISSATLAQANTYLQAGQADQALALLSPLPLTGAGAEQAQNLLCRVRFTLQQWDQAATDCEQAVKLNAESSDDQMWLGRVLGQQASHASIFSAYGIAKRSLAAMQAAVQLNPKNGPALSDLGDYYAQAPEIAGGGIDKAQSVAAQLDKVDPIRAAQLRGDIAVAQKNYTTAEQEYKQAIAASPQPAHEWTVLASFYYGRKRWSDLDTAIQNCVTAAPKDPNGGVPFYDGAGVLIVAKRNPQIAAQMLTNYLAGSWKTEEAPVFIAYIRRSRLKQQLGDSAGAQQDLDAAQNLAREFNPSQDNPK